MFRINLYPTRGKQIWSNADTAPSIQKIGGVWCIGAGSYKVSEKRLPLVGHNDWSLATSALENTVYLGLENGRHYFGVGVGSIFGTGRKPNDPTLSKTKAIHLKNTCSTLAGRNAAVIRPEMILSHGVIPDTEDRPPHDPNEIGNEPCMFVYSTSTRWRLSDLFMLRDSQRKTIFGVTNEHFGWLQQFLHRLGNNWRLFQDTAMVKWKPSLPGIFVDGSFDISVEKTGCSMTEIASTLAEMLRLSIPGSELQRWLA